MNTNTKGKLHEQGFNYQLASVLRETNARWRENREFVLCERRRVTAAQKKRPDILIEDPRMPKVVIECAYGGDDDVDALERLESGICESVISVNIPIEFELMGEEEASERLLAGYPIRYALLQSDDEQDTPYRFPLIGYIEGSVRDLAELVPASSAPKARVEQVADEVASLIDKAAETLQAELSNSDCEEIARKVYQRTPLTAFRTVLVLWLDAMLVQSHLRMQVGDEIDELPMDDIKPSQLIRAWKKILDRNWHSIFKPAVEVLEQTGKKARGPTSVGLNLLASAVEIIETARIGNHVNIGGELFPKISVDQKEAAAYYTTPATAELLTTLLIRESDGYDWQDENLFESLCIADLACGTGTLIRAAFHRIRMFFEASGGATTSLAAFQARAMENGIKAADISPIAAHLTNSSLAVAGVGAPYGQTNIGWVGVGEPVKETSDLSTGSLEFLSSEVLSDLFGELGGRTGGEDDLELPLSVLAESVDYIVMNPPYSRTRGGQSSFDVAGMTKKQRNACQRRWGRLVQNESAERTAGMAASFLCLAQKKVKKGGRIGFVLPMSAAFAKTWSVTREMVVREFKDIVVVARAGSSGGEEALSADTHMGEMLLVATRRNKSGKPKPIHCVTLRRFPIRMGESGEFGRSINNALASMRGDGQPILVGGEELGQIAVARPTSGEPWSHLGVLHADLAVGAKHLADDGIVIDIVDRGASMNFNTEVTSIVELFEVGPTHHLIGHPVDTNGNGEYELHPITRKADSRYGVRSLWEADAATQNKLVVSPTHKGVEWGDDPARLLHTMGTVHYARGMRWTSQSLLAASTKNKVFGGRAWTTLLHSDARVLSAFALWANSTLGLITHWTQGGRTQLGRSPTQVKAIQDIPCPDFGELSSKKLDLAATAFKELSAKQLKPACQAHCDPIRHSIDRNVIQILGLPKKRAQKNIVALRELWCAEPTVHGYNGAALELLRDHDLLD